MKKIILVIILVVGAVAGSSFQVGRVIEAELPTILERVGELGQMQISISSYKRNLFRSVVNSEITLAGVGGHQGKLFLKHEIWHGPFPFGKSSDGQFHFKPMSAIVETSVDQEKKPSGFLRELFELCPELYQSSEITLFDFAGNGASTFAIPGFSKVLSSDTDAMTLDWQGMKGSATIDKSLKKIKGEVTIPKISLYNENGRMESNNIRSGYQIYEDFGGLLLGNVTMDVDAASFNSSHGKTVLSDFQFRNAAKLNEDTVSYSIAIGIEKLQSNDREYGPAGFELDFVGLDAATILDVQKRLQSIQSEVENLSEDEIGAHIFAIYAEALPDLIKRGPEIKLNYLNMTGPGGEFWSKGNILFNNPDGGAINSLESFLGTIRASSDSQISKPLLQDLLTTILKSQFGEARDAGQLGDISDDQLNAMAEGAAAEQLAGLISDGSLVDEGKNYRALLSYENGQTTLNGQPLPDTP